MAIGFPRPTAYHSRPHFRLAERVGTAVHGIEQHAVYGSIHRQPPAKRSAEGVVSDHWQHHALTAEPQKHLAGATQLVELSKYQFNGLLYPLIGIFFDLSMMGPDVTCGKNEPQLAAERLLSDRFQRTLPQKVQLEL